MKYNLKPERMKVFFDYDPEFGRLDWKESPTRSVHPRKPAGTMGSRVKMIQVKGNMIPYSHVVWAWHYDEWPEGDLRHLNGDPFDFRIWNLAIIAKPGKQRPSPEELKELFEYQPDTGSLIWKIPIGRRIKVGSVAGVKHANGIMVTIAGKQYPAHHIIFAMKYGVWPTNGWFGHKNKDKFDNREENLVFIGIPVDKA